MKKYLGILALLGIISIMIFATFANSAATCDATGMYDCTSYNGDSDSDGVCDDWEDGGYGTDKYDADTDGGAACDGDELFMDGTDPNYGNDDFV